MTNTAATATAARNVVVAILLIAGCMPASLHSGFSADYFDGRDCLRQPPNNE
ncbi:hypothetical protein [Andreprevotia chitinilytica]|uniref:hypothetical protein n=1 Tax=Andreprevotia chitinilytica TaxID=396808 RepID=UPI0012EC762D|nr:hypothetical protein [Andreprevotia chitinilytica]